jgi:hypothetical protein
VTVISSILTQAYRESNILSLRKAATTEQTAEALTLLLQLFSAVYGDEAGEGLLDWPLGNYGRENPADYCALDFTRRRLDHPQINRRLIVVNEEARTVYLTPRPQDGSRMALADPFGRLSTVPITLDANGRTIEGGLTLLLDTDGLFAEWFYRADLGSWMRLTNLTADDDMPFPADFDTFFIITLAMRLNPRYGRTLDAQSIAILKSERKKFVNRYLQSLPLDILDDISWPFLSTQGYDQQRAFSSSRNFDRGYWG